MIFGRTWIINPDTFGDAPSIQAGIDSSSSGDTVLVHPGMYYEAINFRGKNIKVTSSGGPAQTTIDASHLGDRVVTFNSGEERAAIISGFTLTGGTGGVVVVNSEASIVDNIITGNSSGQDGGGTANDRAQVHNSGGGIWLWATNAWVHHNTIVENTGNGPNEAYGGGMTMEEPGSPLVEQNIIAFNKRGGGIWCANRTTPLIRNNLAWENMGGDGVRDCADWWKSNGNVIDNPYFCDRAAGDFTVPPNSGVMTHPAGPLGAFATPGCAPVAVHPSTWGSLKARY